MYKKFSSFQEGLKALRKVSFSVRDVLCCVPEEASEEEVLRRLVIYATWDDPEWRPMLTVSGSEVWYRTSGWLVFGWSVQKEESDQEQSGRYVFYLRRPDRYGLRPINQSSLIKAALEEGFLLESDEKAALKAASKA
jgi:hypothetical protein